MKYLALAILGLAQSIAHVGKAVVQSVPHITHGGVEPFVEMLFVVLYQFGFGLLADINTEVARCWQRRDGVLKLKLVI